MTTCIKCRIKSKREGESERDAQILWEVFSAAHTHAERARGRAGRGAEEQRRMFTTLCRQSTTRGTRMYLHPFSTLISSSSSLRTLMSCALRARRC